MTRFWTMSGASQTSPLVGSSEGYFTLHFVRKAADHLTFGWLTRSPISTVNVYHVTDRLHDGRTADVLGHQIAPTVSAWLAELGVESPLVDDLARAVQTGDWPAVYAVGEHLSVDVTLAAA